MKIKIISAYDKNFKEISDLSFPTLEKFSQKNQFDCERFFIEDFKKPAPWFKIDALIKAIELKQHDYVLWIDSDAIIFNQNFDIESIINNNKILHIAKDFNNINSGVMLWKTCEEGLSLLYKIQSMSEKYLNHIWWEQAAIIELYENNVDNILENTKFVEQSTLNAYEMVYYHRNIKKGQINKNSFICHFPSLAIEIRKKLIINYIQS